MMVKEEGRMSNRAATRRIDFVDESADSVSIFPSPIGWTGIVGHGRLVCAVFVGHGSVASIRRATQSFSVAACDGRRLAEFDWHPMLKARLLQYADGHPVDFAEFQLQLPQQTPFRDRVLAVTRRLGYGETTTYGELAKRVGHPGAARAVGTVMSTNRFPILIPCHRVLAAGGKLGGYTSPAGIGLKERLLDMERTGRSSRR
jgi:methylated-DNA-[protein]-cysteine S-methyltransferase